MTMIPGIDPNDRFCGVLLGTAVGDALGLPAEGLFGASAERREATSLAGGRSVSPSRTIQATR